MKTKALIQAVKRNRSRFPPDFMLRLTAREFRGLRSHIVTSKGRGGRRYAPLAFTEQGVAMLSSVLKSDRAIRVNIAIMRAFVRVRAMLARHKDLADRLDALERKHDGRFKVVFDAIRELMAPPRVGPPRQIGFGIATPRRHNVTNGCGLAAGWRQRRAAAQARSRKPESCALK